MEKDMYKRIRTPIAATLAIAFLAAGPAAAQDRWDWSGGRSGDREYGLRGAGVPLLFPELRDSRRGRAFVTRNFDRNHDRFLTMFEARQGMRTANRL